MRAAREMYARAADKLAPWRRLAAWQRLMVAELSDELGDRRQATRESDRAVAAFDRMGCVVADRRVAVLRRGLR